MKRIKRVTSALQRYRRSRGFGIHSPFAFHFVVRVLKEKAPYYCYAELRDRRRLTVRLVSREVAHWPVMSLQNAKMIVRVAAFFNPATVMVVGSHYGLGTAALLNSGTHIRAVVWEGPRCFHDVFVRLTDAVAERIDNCPTLSQALAHYEAAGKGEPLFILANDVAGATSVELEAVVAACMRTGGTAVVRHIDDDEAMAALWRYMSESMEWGMTFTNGKIGVAVMRHGLPRQNFSLWF